MERRLERLRIEEIRDVLDKGAPVFLPIGPLEWHSYHLPFGTDPLDADSHAHGLAERFGGLVHPPMYMGANLTRSREEKEWLGLEQSGEQIIGMDFPGFPVRSMYWTAEAVDSAARQAVAALLRTGFRTVVLLNGHGDDLHRRTLRRVAEEMSGDRGTVLYFVTFWDEDCEQRYIGHADRYETSVAMHNHPSLVRLSKLPADKKLRYSDYGIIEGAAFGGEPTADRCCLPEADPRGSSPEEGRMLFERNVRMIGDVIEGRIQ